MALVKNTACFFLVFLYVAWPSTARLIPTGAKVYEIWDTKESIAINITNGNGVKIMAGFEGNSRESSAKQVVRKSGNRSLRRSRLSDEQFLDAFTADYGPTKDPPITSEVLKSILLGDD